MFGKIRLGEYGMKKLILKTALITLGTIIAVLCILYGVFALFFPLNMASFFDSLGMRDATVSFYELHYENTGDIADLGVLCVKVDECNDAVRAKKYLTILTSSEDFDSYLEDFDKQSNSTISGKEYFNGKLAIAIQKSQGVEEFLTFATKAVDEGYTEFNCFYLALSIDGLFEEEELALVGDALSGLEASLTSSEKTYLERDLEYTKNTDNQ